MTPLSLATHGMLSGEPLCMLTHGWICEEVTPPTGGGYTPGRPTKKAPTWDELQRDRYYQQALAEDEELIEIVTVLLARNLI